MPLTIPLPPAPTYGGMVAPPRMSNTRTSQNQTGFYVEDDKFNRGLATLAHTFSEEVAVQYKRMMSDIERRAKRRAPVRTGNLRAGIWWRVDVDSAWRVLGIIGSHAEYGKYTEFVDKPGGRIRRSAMRHPGMYSGSGTVTDPYTMWPARAGRGANKRGQWGSQTMPWLRPSFLDVFAKVLRGRLQWALRDAIRRM